MWITPIVIHNFIHRQPPTDTPNRHGAGAPPPPPPNRPSRCPPPSFHFPGALPPRNPWAFPFLASFLQVRSILVRVFRKFLLLGGVRGTPPPTPSSLLLYRCKIFFFIKGGDYKGMEGVLSLQHRPMAENSTELAEELNELAGKVLNNYY